MSRLILNPKVHVIARTKVDVDALIDWAEDHGLRDVINTHGTPLNAIKHNLLDGNFDSIDLLPEIAGRYCYASWAKGRDTEAYLANIIDSRHGSVLEHSNISFAITGVSRSLTHEWIRHRVGMGVSQESQRYVDAKDMKFIIPPAVLPLLESDEKYIQDWNMKAEGWVQDYVELQADLERFWSKKYKGFHLKKVVNEAARSQLPNAAETKMVWTGNLRCLRHVFEVRGSLHAEAEIRRLVLKMYEKVQHYQVFADIQVLIDAESCERYINVPFSKV